MSQPSRHIAGAPPSLGPHGRLRCRWCGLEVPKGRLTFCSDRCVQDWVLRASSGAIRAAVFERDQGRCAACGLLTLDFRAGILQALKPLTSAKARTKYWRRFAPLATAILAAKGYRAPKSVEDLLSEGFWWAADHIVPVAEGGGQAGLEALQTLCSPCHRRKSTAEAKARRALKAARAASA